MTNDQASHIAKKCIEIGQSTKGHVNVIIYLPKLSTSNHITDIMFAVEEIPMNATESRKTNVIIN